MKKVILILIMVLYGAIIFSSQTSAQPEGTTSSGITISPVRSGWPIAREASGQWLIAGEAVLSNTGATTEKVVWVRLSTLDSHGEVLSKKTYNEETFRDMFFVYSMNANGEYAGELPGERRLAPGGFGVGLMTAFANSSTTPAHARVEAELSNGKVQIIDVPLYEFDPGQQTIWPLRFTDGDWAAYNTVDTYYHRTSFWERFAIDAFQIDSQYGTSNPPGSPNKEDYYAWGEDILSAGSGTVVALTRNQPDQELSKVWTPEDANPMGNFVIIRHGPELYSLYVHMMRNSATVRVGAQVAAGQVIGKVGNSGMTGNLNVADGQPHLHFQFFDSSGQGVPALFRNAKIIRRSTEEWRRLPMELPPTWDERMHRNEESIILNNATPLHLDIVTAP